MLASFILLLHVIFHSTLSLFVYSACSIEYIDCSTAIYLIFLINLQNYSFLLQPLWYLYCINNNLIFYALNVNFNIIILFASNFQNLFFFLLFSLYATFFFFFLLICFFLQIFHFQVIALLLSPSCLTYLLLLFILIQHIIFIYLDSLSIFIWHLTFTNLL